MNKSNQQWLPFFYWNFPIGVWKTIFVAWKIPINEAWAYVLKTFRVYLK